MDIIEEYVRQQEWRNWGQYVAMLPLRPADRILDLGCSVGGMAGLLAQGASHVTGIDLDANFVDYARERQGANQTFFCADFAQHDLSEFGPVTGVWSSFAMSYIADPVALLRRVHALLPAGGWVGLVEVACFISGNLPPDSRFHETVRAFELASCQTWPYDFNRGATMEAALREAGFDIVHADDNVYDVELNFDGAARDDVLRNWRARMDRMQGMRQQFPQDYEHIAAELLAHLQSPQHARRNNVRFVVATKPGDKAAR